MGELNSKQEYYIIYKFCLPRVVLTEDTHNHNDIILYYREFKYRLRLDELKRLDDLRVITT